MDIPPLLRWQANFFWANSAPIVYEFFLIFR